ncbi:MAG: ATP-dependent zinc protease [Rickettsiaceae bacterium]|jgi:ribosomal protein S6--L-glutamate ligase|nr:ATP-dependent zinc protease [Rickettsiaceae bacterium]
MVEKNSKDYIIGWKEWFSFHDLGLPAIKGKIDTGAKTSSLHAFNIETFTQNGREFVRFQIHPLQKNQKIIRTCTAPIIDHRYVSDSSGKKEKRYVIESNLQIGEMTLKIEVTLANRDTMAFRMLLGREAIKKSKMVVDVSKSFLQGKIARSKVLKFYND